MLDLLENVWYNAITSEKVFFFATKTGLLAFQYIAIVLFINH